MTNEFADRTKATGVANLAAYATKTGCAVSVLTLKDSAHQGIDDPRIDIASTPDDHVKLIARLYAQMQQRAAAEPCQDPPVLLVIDEYTDVSSALESWRQNHPDAQAGRQLRELFRLGRHHKITVIAQCRRPAPTFLHADQAADLSNRRVGPGALPYAVAQQYFGSSPQ